MLEIGKVYVEIANQGADKDQITRIHVIFVKLASKGQELFAVLCAFLVRILLVVIKFKVVALEQLYYYNINDVFVIIREFMIIVLVSGVMIPGFPLLFQDLLQIFARRDHLFD